MAKTGNPLRVYTLDDLPPEVVAVAFAKTSRVPDSFDDIARELSETDSSRFHEKWVIGYGHSSVAEHAVLSIAVENVSILAAKVLEENRLSSFTEKSTRYQVMSRGQLLHARGVRGRAPGQGLQEGRGGALRGLRRAHARGRAALRGQVRQRRVQGAGPEPGGEVVRHRAGTPAGGREDQPGLDGQRAVLCGTRSSRWRRARSRRCGSWRRR